MPRPVACPHCREELDIPPEFRGRAVRCAVCRNTFTTPAADAEPDVPTARRSGTTPRRSYADEDDRFPPDRPRRRRRRRPAGGSAGWVLFVVLSVPVLGCLACGGLVTLFAWIDNPELQRYDDPAGRFQAAFPTLPPAVRQEQTDAGRTRHVVEASREFPQETYFVRYVDLPAKEAGDTDRALTAAADQFVKAHPGATEVSRSDVSHDGLPGLDLHLRHPDNTVTLVRFLMDGTRVYAVGITGQGLDPKSHRIYLFWNAFKVTTKEKK